jgi:hypothetical protein
MERFQLSRRELLLDRRGCLRALRKKVSSDARKKPIAMRRIRNRTNNNSQLVATITSKLSGLLTILTVMASTSILSCSTTPSYSLATS